MAALTKALIIMSTFSHKVVLKFHPLLSFEILKDKKKMSCINTNIERIVSL